MKKYSKLIYYYLLGHFRYYALKALLPNVDTYKFLPLIFPKRVEECKDCYDNRDCLGCGCPVDKLFLSGKKCKKTGIQ